MTVDLKEFVAGFLVESEELMRTLQAGLVQLDSGTKRLAPQPRAVREMYRALHTMKGLAAMVGVEPIVEIAHAMESVLRTADKSGGRVAADAIDALVEGAKALGVRLRAVADGVAVPAAPRGLLANLTGTVQDVADVAPRALGLEPAVLAKLSASDREQLMGPTTGQSRPYAITFRPSAELTNVNINITTVRERVGAVAEVVKIVPLSEQREGGAWLLRFVLLVQSAASPETLAEAASTTVDDVVLVQPDEAPEASTSMPPSAETDRDDGADDAALSASTLRVHVGRMDEAMDRLNALMVNRFKLGRAIDAMTAAGVDTRALREIADETRRQLFDMRATIVSLRMVSIATMLEPLPLLIRGLGASTKKSAVLQKTIGDVEIDKSVAEPLWPAIVHLVRNAVDHGLEAPEMRAAAGKSPQGTIRVSATSRANGQVEIVVEDDGGGIDRQQVAKRASAPVPADDKALLDLLTAPGFSTTSRVSATSGRGMGLDIVKRVVVDQLRGELSVRSAPGLGTAFRIVVPVTLSIVDTFGFESDGQAFLVPVSIVEELIEVEASEVVTSPAPGVAATVAVLRRRGRAIPLRDLATVFGQARAPRCPKAIVVKSSEAFFAFGVDRMLGHQEVVVRPLRDRLVQVPGIVGATDLGDGRPTLVVDLVALTRGGPAAHEARG